MPTLLSSSFIELAPLGNQAHARRREDPFARVLVWHPEIPISLENIGVVVVNEIGGYSCGLVRGDAGIEAPLENRRLVPRNGLHRCICNSEAGRRKGKLLQHADCEGENLRLFEAG